MWWRLTTCNTILSKLSDLYELLEVNENQFAPSRLVNLQVFLFVFLCYSKISPVKLASDWSDVVELKVSGGKKSLDLGTRAFSRENRNFTALQMRWHTKNIFRGGKEMERVSCSKTWMTFNKWKLIFRFSEFHNNLQHAITFYLSKSSKKGSNSSFG